MLTTTVFTLSRFPPAVNFVDRCKKNKGVNCDRDFHKKMTEFLSLHSYNSHNRYSYYSADEIPVNDFFCVTTTIKSNVRLHIYIVSTDYDWLD